MIKRKLALSFFLKIKFNVNPLRVKKAENTISKKNCKQKVPM